MSNTFWVGKPSSIDAAENKLLQLTLARECGLKVPATMISSCPTEVRRFASNFSAVVVKPIDPFAWEYRSSGIAYKSYASIAKPELLNRLPDSDLSVSPTIYQQCFAKKLISEW
jgi:hypothetical protein